MFLLEILKSIILGIVEGITEWLPVSSTGHLILVDEILELAVSENFKDMFEVVIQLGAILAVPTFFFERLNPFSKKKTEQERSATLTLWSKVIVGAIPAAVAGVIMEIFLDDILGEPLNHPLVIASTLIIYGILFIVIEKIKSGKKYSVEYVDDLSYKDALKIGAFQVLSLIPGTSRSGSTILGGMISGVSRTASAEFSFFMAIPIMLGASGLKILKFAYEVVFEDVKVSGGEIVLLLIGIAVSYIVSLFVIKFLMDFVKRHSFVPFGIYRIALGVVVIGYFLIKTIAF